VGIDLLGDCLVDVIPAFTHATSMSALSSGAWIRQVAIGGVLATMGRKP
jgi:hypothetical protein